LNGKASGAGVKFGDEILVADGQIVELGPDILEHDKA
jgi:hypothetical protein